MTVSIGLDVGSNSLGSAWINHAKKPEDAITVGLSIFPAGVKESDEERGAPMNAKRRATRRTRITLARRSQRKRLLRVKQLIPAGLLPSNAVEFKTLLEKNDPWELRRKGLTEPLTPHQFGRVLLHLAQRRGALGFDAEVGDKGEVKKAIVGLQLAMLRHYASEKTRLLVEKLKRQIETLSKSKKRDDEATQALEEAQEELAKLCKSLMDDPRVSFGHFIAELRAKERTPVTTPDRRKRKRGPREWRVPIRNRAGKFRFHADRKLIQNEFAKLWEAQSKPGGALKQLWPDRTDDERKKLLAELRKALDEESRDSNWRRKGLLFGQRKQSWDLGTLGRCVLEPTERCAPHADMYASRYLVVETVNNLKIIEGNKPARPLTPDERQKIKAFLSGPLGFETSRKKSSESEGPTQRRKSKVRMTDLRRKMGEWYGKDKWPERGGKNPLFRFTSETDDEKSINTDWFSREIIHGAVTLAKWEQLPERSQEGINRAILKFDPDDDDAPNGLKTLVMQSWAGLSEEQADKLVDAWKKRPRLDKRLNMSRRAVRNLLSVMDRDEPWQDEKNAGQTRWLDQNTARRLLASNGMPARPASSNIGEANDSGQRQDQTEPKQAPTLSDTEAESLGHSLASAFPTRKAFVRTLRSRGIEPEGHPRSDYFRILRAWETTEKPPHDGFNAQKASESEARQLARLIEVRQWRYATGAKGATARDRHYMRKHRLKKNGKVIKDPKGNELAEPAPAPLISNPVARKAVHEVRRHLIECMTKFGARPDRVYVELSREARMGKKDADRLLFINNLRNRISKEIIEEFKLEGVSSTRQRAAVKRVVLAIQQGCRCALCGKRMYEEDVGCKKDGITLRTAAYGQGCEVAHIIPKGCGGDNGWRNIVLAHETCNQDMQRHTPREFWGDRFDEMMKCVERMYGDIERPDASKNKKLEGDSLWLCYFTRRDDQAKIAQFKKAVSDTQQMTPGQDAATKYATRQVMTYLADALFDGKGLPERGGDRLVFESHKRWTALLRQEWGLHFDRHGARAKGLTSQQENERKEKDRRDHRHHAIDAVVTALCTPAVRAAWDEREKKAEQEGVNIGNEEAMKNYRRLHPLPPPAPFQPQAESREAVEEARERLRKAVERAIFGDGEPERPVCHRPVKRKLIGAFHEETLFGPMLDENGKLTENYRARKSILQLDPSHLRLHDPEPRKAAQNRLTQELKSQGLKPKEATIRAKQILNDPAYKPREIEPAPGKGGIVRDVELRRILLEQLPKHREEVIQQLQQQLPQETDSKRRKEIEVRLRVLSDSLDFKSKGNAAKKKFQKQLKAMFSEKPLCMKSGVPIHSVVLLRTMSDPVVLARWSRDYATGERHKAFDPTTNEGDPTAARAYVGGNNHHIEIRFSKKKKGNEKWKGIIVTAFDAALLKLARLHAFKEARIPKLKKLRELPEVERRKYRSVLCRIEKAHPIVDRSDDDKKGGKFVMSLCEGEMLLMCRKPKKKGEPPGEVGYFVVAKLDKPQSIVVVPHWDARPAKERKDSEGKKIPDSKREQFAVTPSDLKKLAPPGHEHAVKVRVSPLGEVVIVRD